MSFVCCTLVEIIEIKDATRAGYEENALEQKEKRKKGDSDK